MKIRENNEFTLLGNVLLIIIIVGFFMFVLNYANTIAPPSDVSEINDTKAPNVETDGVQINQNRDSATIQFDAPSPLMKVGTTTRTFTSAKYGFNVVVPPTYSRLVNTGDIKDPNYTPDCGKNDQICLFYNSKNTPKEFGGATFDVKTISKISKEDCENLSSDSTTKYNNNTCFVFGLKVTDKGKLDASYKAARQKELDTLLSNFNFTK